MSSGPIPKRRSASKPRKATQRLDASVPAINFGHLTHTVSPNTVWDVRVGRFRFTQDTSPTSGDPTIPHRIDQPENIWSGGPQQIGQVRQVRTTVKATVSHYRAGWFGADHEWRMGAQVDRGEHRAVAVLPTGASSVYINGVLSQRTLQAPANSGGRFVTAAVFVSDAVRLGTRVTINPGLRFDHSRAISQDVPEFDGLVRGDRTDHRRPGHGGRLEHRVAARGRRHQARYRRPNDASSECREIQPGPVDW